MIEDIFLYKRSEKYFEKLNEGIFYIWYIHQQYIYIYIYINFFYIIVKKKNCMKNNDILKKYREEGLNFKNDHLSFTIIKAQ